MRAVVQRVSRAKVTVAARVTGEIERGLLVLLGAGAGDGPADLAYVVDKVTNLRIFPDDAGKMNRSVLDIGALEPAAARALYEQSLDSLRAAGVRRVEAGEFAADMAVELVNDGPVTILLDSRKGF